MSMRQAAPTEWVGSGLPLAAGIPPSSSGATERDPLKRFPQETRAAFEEFRRRGDPGLLPVIVDGVIERYLDPAQRTRLRSGGDSLRLAQDLGVDSLTLLEIVFLAEEILGVSIDNEELRPACTVGEIKRIVASKVERLRGGNAPGV